LEEFEAFSGNGNSMCLNKQRLLYPLLKENNYTINQTQETCCVISDQGKRANLWKFDHVVSNGVEINIQKCPKIERIPNKTEPSDHLPIKFTITLKT
jgi:hypothetical protein